MKILLFILSFCCIHPLFSQQLNIKSGSTYAVVVGISDYQDENIPDLRFADKDALAFAGFLQSPTGGLLDKDHLKLLINEKATVAQFVNELYWLQEVAKEKDRIIIYFSGHGDVERNSLTQPGFLLCWDAPEKVYLAGGTLPLPMFQEVISTLSVQNKAKVIVIMDACRSGKLSGSSVGGAQLTSNNLAKQYANEIKLLSCQPDEYSIEGEQWGGGRGAFSYHLLDGLYGMADQNDDLSVNLFEIGRYLEDNVAAEVAPISQIPMTVGSRSEQIVRVQLEILRQLEEGRKTQMQMFITTESRGIEDLVLAKVDSNIVKLYLAFQKTLRDKKFLSPPNACSNFYYEKLRQEPQLKPLHSSMRRNYAAALQDDAQQVMNKMLKPDLTREAALGKNERFVYKNYPAYIAKAAELLGEDHYMYTILQARKYFFLAKSLNNGSPAQRKLQRAYYLTALEIHSDMPHALVEMIRSSESNQLDSAELYFNKALEMIPSWVEPYIAMSEFHEYRTKNYSKASSIIELALDVDTTSTAVWYQMAKLAEYPKNLHKSISLYQKILASSNLYVCLPCVNFSLANNLFKVGRKKEAEEVIDNFIHKNPNDAEAHNVAGQFYGNVRNYNIAKEMYKKAITLDSTNPQYYVGLGKIYFKTGQIIEGEKHFLKGIQLAPENIWLYNQLARMYREMGQYEEAEKQLKKAIQLYPEKGASYEELGYNYILTGQYDEAEKQLKKAILLAPDWTWSYSGLGYLYIKTGQYEEAEKQLKKAIQIDSTNGNFGGILGNYYTHQHGHLEDAKKELDKAVELSPHSPDIHIYLAQWYIKKDKLVKAWQHLEQGLEKGLGKVYLQLKDLEDGPDFEEMRKDERWEELMKKYFQKELKK